MRKKLHNLIILATAAISVTACTKEHYTSNSSTYITYSSSSERATGAVDFPVTGITLSPNTTTSVTWSCPRGYVLPNALAANPPQPGDTFYLKNMNPTLAGGHATTREAWIMREKHDGWVIKGGA